MPRYIDADALTEKLGSLMKRYAEQGRKEVAQDCNWVCIVLDFAPTADVAPVVHGRWIEKEDGFGDTYYDCSVCRESFCLIDGMPTDNLCNYCPNCGAKMDLEGT